MKTPLRSAVAIAFLSFALTASAVEGAEASSPLDRGHASAGAASLPPANPLAASQVRVSDAYGKLPLSFEANRGQTDPVVKFLARGPHQTLFLTANEAVLVFTKAEQAAGGGEPRAGSRRAKRDDAAQTALRMTFLGANPEPRVVGRDELPGKANYFIGNDPTKWRTNVPTYAKVQYQDIYPGVNVIYYGNQRQLEYDLVVRPGAAPDKIVLRFEGADTVEVNPQGDLVLHTAAGVIRQRTPVIYQEVEGRRRTIAGGYVLKGLHQVGFQTAAYDPQRPLIIDPVLVYSTYLGGTNGGGEGSGIAVDAAGNAYVTGWTSSSSFPTTTGAFQTALGGFPTVLSDAFVTKLNPSGSDLLYSTYLGGSGVEDSTKIAVDAAGNAYVTGRTTSTDFPTTTGGFQTASGGADDAFVTKLNPSGSGLLYSTYLGGSGADEGHGIAVDASGKIYITGGTSSTNFPTTTGAFQTAGNGFVTKLNPSGAGLADLVYSTYICGGYGIAVDAAGIAYVTGWASSCSLPTTTGAFQTAPAGPTNAFVMKLNPGASGTASLIYSTYLGGNNGDQGFGIAVDAAGNAYVTGTTGSSNFPTTTGAFQTTHGGGGQDAFVAKLNPSGSGSADLVYSTYLGGSDVDVGFGIAVDAVGNAYVTGYTASSNFPTTTGALRTVFGGATDAFVTTLNPSGSDRLYSTYLGGSTTDIGYGIAVDASGNAYVTGATGSSNFPTTTGAFQATYPGVGAAFVTKLATRPALPVAWGLNADGRLGDGSTTERHTPVQVSNLTDVITVSGGEHHSLALRADGTVWAWGSNVFGALGDGSTAAESHTPVQVANLTGVISVAAGTDHALALKSDGTVWAWGRNDFGQLGDGTNTDRHTPVQVKDPSDPSGNLTDVIAIATKKYHNLALKSNGEVWAWGPNDFGQLGNGIVGGASTAPVKVGNLAGATAIATGPIHSLAVKSNGTVWAWGGGLLGNGADTITATPVQVSNLADAIAVAAGNTYSLARKADGSVWAWGRNDFGQLGDGTTTDRLTPVQMSGLAGITGLAAGAFHSLALKADGTVWTWGFNNHGQLGDATTTDHLAPIRVNALTGVIGIGAGFFHSLAVVLPNTPVGSNVVVQPRDAATGATPVTVTFSSVTQAGITSLSISSSGPPPPAGFRLGTGLYYEITTTATFSGTVTVCIDYSGTPLAGTTTQPTFSHFENGQWVAVTVTSWNQANNIICGTVTSLSPFALFEAADTTPPTTTASPSPGPNANGWNNTDVTVTLGATDDPGGSGVKEVHFSLAGAQGGTGIVSGATASVTVSAEGITTLTYFATDNAGNQETPKTLTVRIDRTPPTLACSVRPNTLWPPDHRLVPVAASVTVTDALSGPAGLALVSVTSSEPDNGLGDGDQPNDIQGFVVGTPSTSGLLRAERSGRGTGRVYTLIYRGADQAGNTATCSAMVIVPHDRRQ